MEAFFEGQTKLHESSLIVGQYSYLKSFTGVRFVAVKTLITDTLIYFLYITRATPPPPFYLSSKLWGLQVLRLGSIWVSNLPEYCNCFPTLQYLECSLVSTHFVHSAPPKRPFEGTPRESRTCDPNADPPPKAEASII